MAKQTSGPKSGFVIKLSCETVQKLAEEEQIAKNKQAEEAAASRINTADDKKVQENVTESSKKVKKTLLEVSSGSDENIKPDSEPLEAQLNPKDGTEVESNTSDAECSELWGEYAQHVTYEGEEAIYTDPSTQHKYTWNKATNAWESKGDLKEVPGREYSYEDDTHVYTEPDGTKFFWDEDKKAWIPKVDDDFLAFYQMSYGFVDNTTKEKESKEEIKKKEVQKKLDAAGVKRKSEPQWFQPAEETNTKVYVSNLPLDMTEEEFVNLMQKFGLVERDPHTQNMKVKLYMDKEQNCFKGDALCTYIKIESVDLALKLLDGSDYKGNTIKVERASFQMKGNYNPSLKPKKKKKKELDKIKKMQQKLFDWRPEKFIGERSKHERIVIVKNLFHPSDFDKDVQLILDYQQDMREECAKSGEVRKVVIYDQHPEGVAQITMKEPEQADAVVALINGRWFGKKQITAEIWDGRTKYRIAEADAALTKRIDKWDKFLEGKEDDKKADEASAKEVEPSIVDSVTKTVDGVAVETTVVTDVPTAVKDVPMVVTDTSTAVTDASPAVTDASTAVTDTSTAVTDVPMAVKDVSTAVRYVSTAVTHMSTEAMECEKTE